MCLHVRACVYPDQRSDDRSHEAEVIGQHIVVERPEHGCDDILRLGDQLLRLQGEGRPLKGFCDVDFPHDAPCARGRSMADQRTTLHKHAQRARTQIITFRTRRKNPIFHSPPKAPYLLGAAAM